MESKNSLFDAIKFVASAVNDKSSVLELQCLLIENGQLRASDGVLTLGSPVDLDLACAPRSETLLKAIKGCGEVFSFNVTPTNRLSVKSGRFRALVPCLETSDVALQMPKPAGVITEVDGELILNTLKRLEPFVASDGLRPWNHGVLFRGQSALATNNVCLIECWLGIELPFTINIPMAAIKAVIKQNMPPTRVLTDGSSVTFFYESGRWIKTQLLDTEWPPLENMMNVQSNPRPVPDGFFEGLKAIEGFSPNLRVMFQDGMMHSDDIDADGATYEVDNLPRAGIYHLPALRLLEGVATSIDLDRYPDNAVFYGENVRGVVVSMRA